MSDKRAQRWSFRSQVRDITELPAMRILATLSQMRLLRVSLALRLSTLQGLSGTSGTRPTRRLQSLWRQLAPLLTFPSVASVLPDASEVVGLAFAVGAAAGLQTHR